MIPSGSDTNLGGNFIIACRILRLKTKDGIAGWQWLVSRNIWCLPQHNRNAAGIYQSTFLPTSVNANSWMLEAKEENQQEAALSFYHMVLF